MQVVQRLTIVLRCDHCGTGLRMRMTGRRYGDLIRLRADRDDRAMQRLFTTAHRGPFTPGSVR